jgi:hypothetical protein
MYVKAPLCLMIGQVSPNIEGGQRAIDNHFYAFSSFEGRELRNSVFFLGVTTQLRSGTIFQVEATCTCSVDSIYSVGRTPKDATPLTCSAAYKPLVSEQEELDKKVHNWKKETYRSKTDGLS